MNTFTVIGDPNKTEPAFCNGDGDPSGPCVDTVFDQFLTTDAGRSITSPAAILEIVKGSSRRITETGLGLEIA